MGLQAPEERTAPTAQAPSMNIQWQLLATGLMTPEPWEDSKSDPPKKALESTPKGVLESRVGGSSFGILPGLWDLTADFKKLEHGCRMIYAGVPSSFALGLEDGHVSTFWLLL